MAARRVTAEERDAAAQWLQPGIEPASMQMLLVSGSVLGRYTEANRQDLFSKVLGGLQPSNARPAEAAAAAGAAAPSSWRAHVAALPRQAMSSLKVEPKLQQLEQLAAAGSVVAQHMLHARVTWLAGEAALEGGQTSAAVALLAEALQLSVKDGDPFSGWWMHRRAGVADEYAAYHACALAAVGADPSCGSNAGLGARVRLSQRNEARQGYGRAREGHRSGPEQRMRPCNAG